MTAPTLQGMARVRSGQARPGPWFLTGVSAVVSGVKRDFACTFTGALPLVLVALRAQSPIRLEGGHVRSAGHPRAGGQLGLLHLLRRYDLPDPGLV